MRRIESNDEASKEPRVYGHTCRNLDGVTIGEGSRYHNFCRDVLKNYKINDDFSKEDKKFLLDLRKMIKDGTVDQDTMDLIKYNQNGISDYYEEIENEDIIARLFGGIDLMEKLMDRILRYGTRAYNREQKRENERRKANDMPLDFPADESLWICSNRLWVRGDKPEKDRTKKNIYPGGSPMFQHCSWKEILPTKELYMLPSIGSTPHSFARKYNMPNSLEKLIVENKEINDKIKKINDEIKNWGLFIPMTELPEKSEDDSKYIIDLNHGNGSIYLYHSKKDDIIPIEINQLTDKIVDDIIKEGPTNQVQYLETSFTPEQDEIFTKNDENNEDFSDDFKSLYINVLHHVNSKKHFFYGLIKPWSYKYFNDDTFDDSKKNAAFYKIIKVLMSDEFFGLAYGMDSFFFNRYDIKSINLNWIDTSEITNMCGLFKGDNLPANNIRIFNPKESYRRNDIVQIQGMTADGKPELEEAKRTENGTEKSSKRKVWYFWVCKVQYSTPNEYLGNDFDENEWQLCGKMYDSADYSEQTNKDYEDIQKNEADKEQAKAKNGTGETFKVCLIPFGGRLNISLWNVSKVKNMSYMFAMSNFSEDFPIKDWNTSIFITTESMFDGSSYKGDLGKLKH